MYGIGAPHLRRIPDDRFHDFLLLGWLRANGITLLVAFKIRSGCDVRHTLCTQLETVDNERKLTYDAQQVCFRADVDTNR